MVKHLTIHIPYDLAAYVVRQRSLVTKYETNCIIKALDTWLVLKSESRSSWLQNWNEQKQRLFSICKIPGYSFSNFFACYLGYCRLLFSIAFVRFICLAGFIYDFYIVIVTHFSTICIFLLNNQCFLSSF